MTTEDSIRMALAEERIKVLRSILVWTLTPLIMITSTAVGFAWKSNTKSVEMETELIEIKKEIVDLTESANQTNLDLGIVQDWADERFELKK